MKQLQEFWTGFIKFLKAYDMDNINKVIHDLEWRAVVSNPLTWLIGLPLLAYLVWKKQVKLIILLCSVVAFMYLLQDTLPPGGEKIPLPKLLQFIGGSVLLVGVNLYFLLIRER